MPTLTVTLPRPLDWQRQVMNEARRFNVLAIGRRAGKSELGKMQAVTPEVLREPVGWFSPTYKDMTEVWRDMSARLAPIVARQNATERRLEYVTGGVLEFWSLDNPQAGRGRKYKRVIVDEAAFVSGLMDSWNFAIRPTLADLRGDAWFLSTPKGRNGFWQLWQYGNDPHEIEWGAWQMPSEINPLIPRDELQAMRRQLPERVAQQELDAAFIEDAGGVFRHVMAASTAVEQTEAADGHAYIISCDWGQSNDFTVYAVFDVNERACVYLDRFNQIDYELQKGRLMGLVRRFRPAQVIAESNSMGKPIIDSLVTSGAPVVPFVTTNATKAAAIQALQLGFETGDIRIIPDPVLISELQAYEMGKTATGMPKYSAPEGMHDDTVMALAIGWQSMAGAWLAW